MPAETHSQIASFIWSICNLLRGPYKRNEYRKVILPLTVLRRFDCILASTKAAALKEHSEIKAKPENIIRHKLCAITGHPFYNLSKFTFDTAETGKGFNGLLDDPNRHRRVSGRGDGEAGRAGGEGGGSGGAAAGIPHRPHHRRRDREN